MSNNIVESKIISQDLRDKADAIKKTMSFDGKTGVVTAGEGVFENTLPENVTLKDCKAVVSALSDFAVASQVAFSEIAIDGLKKHSELESVTTSIPTIRSHDKINHEMLRSQEVRVPGKKDGDGSTITKYGSVKSSIEIAGVSTRNSTMKKVATYFSQDAAEKLGKK